MTVSIFRIAEQCRVTIPDINIQVIIAEVIDSLAVVAKNQWFENREDGISEVDGQFIYTFGKTTPLLPQIDTQTDEYYIQLPSNYLRLPHEMGINAVSYMKDRRDFVRITSSNLWNGLRAGVLGGRQTYRIEGMRMYFPKMQVADVGDILLKMAIALNNVDVREELNISPDMISQIVIMVNQKFMPAEVKK